MLCAGFLASIALTVFVIHRINWSLSLKVLAETFLNILILGSLLLFRPFRAYILRLPLPHLTVLSTLIYGLCVGQLIPAARTTFPFVPWQMFANVMKEGVYYAYWGLSPSGARVRINVGAVFPSLREGRISGGLRQRMSSIRNGGTKPPSEEVQGRKGVLRTAALFVRKSLIDEYDAQPSLAERKKQFNDILIAIGEMYNRKTHEPVHSLEVSRCVIALADQAPRCETVWQVDLEHP